MIVYVAVRYGCVVHRTRFLTFVPVSAALFSGFCRATLRLISRLVTFDYCCVYVLHVTTLRCCVTLVTLRCLRYAFAFTFVLLFARFAVWLLRVDFTLLIVDLLLYVLRLGTFVRLLFRRVLLRWLFTHVCVYVGVC